MNLQPNSIAPYVCGLPAAPSFESLLPGVGKFGDFQGDFCIDFHVFALGGGPISFEDLFI